MSPIIYILPSEPLVPPRAVIGELTEEGGIEGTLITWSQDTGYWFAGEQPVIGAINEALTQRARELGVDL